MQWQRLLQTVLVTRRGQMLPGAVLQGAKVHPPAPGESPVVKCEGIIAAPSGIGPFARAGLRFGGPWPAGRATVAAWVMMTPGPTRFGTLRRRFNASQ